MVEIEEITDRVSVIRDGNYVGTVRTADVGDEGDHLDDGRTRDLRRGASQDKPVSDEVVLKVENLSRKLLHNVNFELRKGRDPRFAGLMGRPHGGGPLPLRGRSPHQRRVLHGNRVSINNRQAAVKNGIGYCPRTARRSACWSSRTSARTR